MFGCNVRTNEMIKWISWEEFSPKDHRPSIVTTDPQKNMINTWERTKRWSCCRVCHMIMIIIVSISSHRALMNDLIKCFTWNDTCVVIQNMENCSMIARRGVQSPMIQSYHSTWLWYIRWVRNICFITVFKLFISLYLRFVQSFFKSVSCCQGIPIPCGEKVHIDLDRLEDEGEATQGDDEWGVGGLQDGYSVLGRIRQEWSAHMRHSPRIAQRKYAYLQAMSSICHLDRWGGCSCDAELREGALCGLVRRLQDEPEEPWSRHVQGPPVRRTDASRSVGISASAAHVHHPSPVEDRLPTDWPQHKEQDQVHGIPARFTGVHWQGAAWTGVWRNVSIQLLWASCPEQQQQQQSHCRHYHYDYHYDK